MLWEVEIEPKGEDGERNRVSAEYDLLTPNAPAATVFERSARGYLLEGKLDRAAMERLMGELLVDPLAEKGRLTNLAGGHGVPAPADRAVTVLLKPGAM